MMSRQSGIVFGGLARQAEVRYPTSSILPVKPIYFPKDAVKLYYASKDAPVCVKAKLLSYYIGLFYAPPEDISNGMRAGKYCIQYYFSLLISLVDSVDQIRTKLLEAFSSLDMDIHLLPLSTEKEVKAALLSTKEWKYIKETLSSDVLDEIMEYREIRLSLLGTVFLMLAELLTPKIAPNWASVRFKTFSEALGMNKIGTPACANLTPNIRMCVAIYNIFSNFDLLRKLAYESISSLSLSRNDEAVAKMASEVIKWFSGYKLSHLIIVNRYLVGMYPELFNELLGLRFELPALEAAFTVLNSVPPDVRYQIRLFKSKESTDALEGRHFPLSITAAECIAKMLNGPTIKFPGRRPQGLLVDVIISTVERHVLLNPKQAPSTGPLAATDVG